MKVDPKEEWSPAPGVPPFTERVWKIIRSIPAGQVLTYGEVAQRLGSRASRAVGRACGSSPGMPDVPCHRVVNSRGFLHGFNGGLEQKRMLLQAEGVRLRPRLVHGKVTDYQVVDFRK